MKEQRRTIFRRGQLRTFDAKSLQLPHAADRHYRVPLL